MNEITNCTIHDSNTFDTDVSLKGTVFKKCNPE